MGTAVQDGSTDTSPHFTCAAASGPDRGCCGSKLRLPRSRPIRKRTSVHKESGQQRATDVFVYDRELPGIGDDLLHRGVESGMETMA